MGGARGRGPQCGRFVKRSGYLEAIERGNKNSNAVGDPTVDYAGVEDMYGCLISLD